MGCTSEDGSVLGRLAKTLAGHPTTRFFLKMHHRYQDSHLKDLIASDMDDQRRITVAGRTVYNFGSDSFFGT